MHLRKAFYLTFKIQCFILLCLLSVLWLLYQKKANEQIPYWRLQEKHFQEHVARSRNITALCANDSNCKSNKIFHWRLQEKTIHELVSRSRNISALCANDSNFKSDKIVSNDEKTKGSKVRMNKLPRDLLIMPEKRLAWCMVPKVASTSISTAIVEVNNQMSLLTDIRQTQVFLKKVYKSANSAVFLKNSKEYISFYITRNPFDRIVSSYRSKLENSSVHDGEYFYNHYGKKIVESFRKKINVTIQEIRKEPTFAEFISYLFETKVAKYDLHWKPISLMCDICNYQYNFTLKFENFYSEFQAFVTYLKNGKYLPESFEIKWKNKVNNNGQSNEITKTYMKLLPRNYVKKLYEIYKNDFIYFGYDENEYF